MRNAIIDISRSQHAYYNADNISIMLLYAT